MFAGLSDKVKLVIAGIGVASFIALGVTIWLQHREIQNTTKESARYELGQTIAISASDAWRTSFQGQLAGLDALNTESALIEKDYVDSIIRIGNVQAIDDGPLAPVLCDFFDRLRRETTGDSAARTCDGSGSGHAASPVP